MHFKGQCFVLTAIGYLLFSCWTLAGTITLSTDINLPAPNPDPNEVITVWIHSDAPLFFMNMLIRINGDATITAAMNKTDCNDFGWDSEVTPISTINPDNSIQFLGLNWSNNYNETIGYLKFRCNSGQVSVYIDNENSLAFSWSEGFTYSTEPIVVGTLTLPPVKKSNEPAPVFMHGPAGLSDPPRGELNCFVEWHQQKVLGVPDSESNIIEINSDITTNQIWDANDVYYITAETVNVQALLVIEPGTTVVFDYGCGLFVNNGGTLISKGTPNKPIIYTPDFMYFSYPDYIGYYWQIYHLYGPHYHCPIYIEETASPLTTVQYCMVEGAVGGVITNNIRLSQPIENNYLFGNAWGVYEFGPLLTDVRNNLCFYQDQAAIEIELCPDPNGFADLDHAFKIEHNTCDGSGYTYCGITVHGVADPNSSGIPTIYLTNNIVTGNYNYGLNLVDGAMYALVVSTGYFDNYHNKNWEFDEYNPVITKTNPYYPYILDNPWQHHYLVDDTDFVDAGLQYIERSNLIGTKTNADNLPDKGIVDLGFHHSMWDYVGGEGIAGTDINDLIEISDYWLTWTPYDPNSPNYQDPNIVDPNTISYGGDWNGDGFVDLADFAILAGMWKAAPEVPNLVPVINGDPNDGWIQLSAGGYNLDTRSIFAFVNGKYVGQVYGFGTDTPVSVDVSESGNIPQELKFVAIDGGGYFAYSEISAINYTSPLRYCILSQSYEPNEPLYFAAYNINEDTSVNVYANGGSLVWSQTYNGNTVSGSIPASITGQQEIDYVSFESSGAVSVLKTTDIAESAVSPPDPNVKALIILPDRIIRIYDFRTISQIQNAFKDRGIQYKRLTGESATYQNIAKYAKTGNVKYLYTAAHGSHVGSEDTLVFRTGLGLHDGWVVSAKHSDFPPGQAPLWCEKFPDNLEETTKSFASMGFNSLEFAYFDVCYSGRLKIGAHGYLVEGSPGQIGLFDGPHSDMSLALGMGDTSKSRIYQGWYDEVESRLQVWPFETAYQKFSRHEWESLSSGNNLIQAITFAINKQTNFGPDAPVNNYRLKGQGSLTDIRLRSN